MNYLIDVTKRRENGWILFRTPNTECIVSKADDPAIDVYTIKPFETVIPGYVRLQIREKDQWYPYETAMIVRVQDTVVIRVRSDDVVYEMIEERMFMAQWDRLERQYQGSC
jgi:hypothetical protein